jgi:hypothetical protein
MVYESAAMGKPLTAAEGGLRAGREQAVEIKLGYWLYSLGLSVELSRSAARASSGAAIEFRPDFPAPRTSL